MNCAYRKDGPDAWTTNVDGAASVARAAVAAGARLIHLSSDLVFPGRSTGYTETSEPSPLNDYGRSKAASERAVTMIDPSAAIIRTSLMYSAEHVAASCLPILEAAKGRQSSTFFVDEYRSFAHVDDVASSLMDLCYHDYAGVLHVAGPEALSRYDFACRFARRHGLDPTRLIPGLQPMDGEQRPGRLMLDSSRAGGLLTTRMRGVTEMLGVPTP